MYDINKSKINNISTQLNKVKRIEVIDMLNQLKNEYMEQIKYQLENELNYTPSFFDKPIFLELTYNMDYLINFVLTSYTNLYIEYSKNISITKKPKSLYSFIIKKLDFYHINYYRYNYTHNQISRNVLQVVAKDFTIFIDIMVDAIDEAIKDCI